MQREAPPHHQPLDNALSTVYIERGGACLAKTLNMRGHKAVLIVLFIPSVERDGTTPIDQNAWVTSALEMFGRVFGGATAYPKARGVWRDNDHGGTLVMDEPIVMHCYTTPADIQDARNLAELGRFCRKMGREARQGEIGLVVGDEYFAIHDFAEE